MTAKHGLTDKQFKNKLKKLKYAKKSKKKPLTRGQLWFRSLSEEEQKAYVERKMTENMIQSAMKRDNG